MVAKTWELAYKELIKTEGGYVNHPKDPGGMTNLGVTKRAWEAYIGRKVTEQEMRGLTKEKVKPFYKVKYWDAVRGDELPAGLDYAVFDFYVNSGGRAIIGLQRVLGVADDGNFGKLTMAAVKKANIAVLIDKLQAHRLTFLTQLSTWKTFGKGWKRRVAHVETLASKLATA